MILTLTPNPSIDATMQLTDPLQRGQVIRPAAISQVAGGKGVNVTHALTLAGRRTLAVVPADEDDPFIALARQADIPIHAVPVTEGVRMNTTLTEPDGTTTKINGPGATITDDAEAEIIRILTTLGTQCSWLVLAGSLPPGVPTDWYTRVLATVRRSLPGLPVAVDTSDEAIMALGEGLETAAPNLLKPNGLELGQLVGVDGEELESAAADGDLRPVVDAARKIITRGVEEVLVTLGASGAVLVIENRAWHATPPPVEVKSTVGAGDSSLAGYLMARADSLPADQCLVRAVAYGAAATALPGTTIPSPGHLNLTDTRVRELHS